MYASRMFTRLVFIGCKKQGALIGDEQAAGTCLEGFKVKGIFDWARVPWYRSKAELIALT